MKRQRNEIKMSATTEPLLLRTIASEHRMAAPGVSGRSDTPRLAIHRLTDDQCAGEPKGLLAFKLFRNEELVPPKWRVEGDGNREPAQFRVFNPTIIAVGAGYAMVYRVVDDSREVRRLASCLLTKDFDVVPGSVTPLSELISFAGEERFGMRELTWHADPRFAGLGGRIYLTWNDGGNKPVNHQFIVRMDEQGLRPVEAARELTRDYGRTTTEKNWTLFESEGRFYAIYSIAPHEVLELDFALSDRVVCREVTLADWHSAYAEIYGVLRGGAAPVRDGEGFLTVAHSSYKSLEGRRYTACFYRFEATPPFRVTHVPLTPLELVNPRGTSFELPRLNPEVCEVIYPCGLVLENDRAVISYGINDEVCAVARMAVDAIRESMTEAGPHVVRRVEQISSSHMPAPLRRVRPARIPLFWWDAKGKRFGRAGTRKFQFGNFGDVASMDIVQRITQRRVRAPKAKERKLLCVGSVLHTARNGDIVWGAGAKGGKTELAPGVRDLSVHAVRGPLTLDVLRRHKIDLSKVKELFDPGCLIPKLYAKEIRELAGQISPFSRGYRIVPHYNDDLIMRRKYFKHLNHFVSVDATPAEFIANIFGAERVISSSLHGIIFAEALGIPACWLAPVSGEDDLKYYDYYFGTQRWAVKRFESVEEALRGEPMALPTFRQDAYLATFPYEELAALGVREIRLNEKISFGSLAKEELGDYVDVWNFELHDKNGIWSTGNRSRLQTHIKGCDDLSVVQLEIVLRPFNPPAFKQPQSVEIIANLATRTCIEWPRCMKESVKARFRIPHNGGSRCFVDLLMIARNARSPRSLGLAPERKPLAFCLESIVASEAKEMVTKEEKKASSGAVVGR